MDALELLKTWPSWARAGAETILASPAWRMQVRFGSGHGVMTVGEAFPDALCLDIAFDGEPFVLALSDTSLYPDLHALWTRRADLPREIVLALIEKECGDVLTMLENLVRRQLSITGISEATSVAGRSYAVAVPGGAFGFALAFPPETVQAFARLENLDASHPAIREMTRAARADYAVLMLTEEERQALKPSDLLLLPETFPTKASWIVGAPSEGAVRLLSAAETEISFGAFADDRLPAIPPPDALRLVEGGRTLFAGELTRVGDVAALRLLPPP